MKASRRGFLGLLAATPVVGSSLVKETAKVSALKVEGVNLSSNFSSGVDYLEHNTDFQKNHVKKSGPKQRLSELLRITGFLKKKGVPDFEKQQWMRDHHITTLDVDLAVNRSMSLAAKLHIQRDRDWKERENEILNKCYDQYNLLNALHIEAITKEMRELGLIYENNQSSYTDDINID